MNYTFSIKSFAFAIACLFIWGCNNAQQEGEVKGIRYVLRKKGDGNKINDSSGIQLKLKIYNSKDSLIQNTYDSPESAGYANLKDPRLKKDPMADILFAIDAQEGDSLTIYYPADSMFKNPAQRPPFVEAGTEIRWEVLISSVISAEELVEENKRMQEEYMQKMMEQQKAMQQSMDSIKSAQVEYIENTYFPEKGITDFKKTESGLFYTVDKAGKADLKEGDAVKVNYEGTLLTTGEKFDSSFDRGEMFEFNIGSGVIQGWSEGIPLIGRGGKGTLYIPSHLGYGPRGAGASIPPNAMLVFRVEVAE